VTLRAPSGAFSYTLIVGVLLADALCKFIAQRLLPPTGITLLPSFEMRIFENTHGPFGLLPRWLAIALSAVVLMVILGYFLRIQSHEPRRSVHWFVSFIIGGGIANLLERALLGYTTDVLWLWNLTALNVADLAILGGLSGLGVIFGRELLFTRNRRASASSGASRLGGLFL
jgi:signal peptidase II